MMAVVLHYVPGSQETADTPSWLQTIKHQFYFTYIILTTPLANIAQKILNFQVKTNLNIFLEGP